MNRDDLIEMMARVFCDRMWEVSLDGRRSRWGRLKESQKARYLVAAGAVLDLQSTLATKSPSKTITPGSKAWAQLSPEQRSIENRKYNARPRQ